MKFSLLVVATLFTFMAAMNVNRFPSLDDAALAEAVGQLDLSMLAAAAEGRTAYTASQMEMAEAMVALNPLEPVEVEVAEHADEDSSDDDEVEMGLGENEMNSFKAYRKHQAERKLKAREARSLPERHGPDWLRAMKHFKSAKRYIAAIDDLALWLDNICIPSRAKQGVLLEKLVVDYFQYYYDQVDYLGKQCNRGTTMRSIQSMMVKYWKHVYNSDFKLLAPAISDMCSMWEKIQPAVTKTEVR